AAGSPPQQRADRRRKGAAPPVRSLYDDVPGPRLGSTALTSGSPVSGVGIGLFLAEASSVFSPASMRQPRKTPLSPAQLDPFYAQGPSLTSEAQLDGTWVTVFGFPQGSVSYILLQLSQYGNVLKHMSNGGNWMHIRYQSRLQARIALSENGKIFGDSIVVGVSLLCLHHVNPLLKSVMENMERSSTASMSAVYTPAAQPVGTLVPPANSATRLSAARPLARAHNPFQIFSLPLSPHLEVVPDRPIPRKDASFLSKVLGYVFGW
ncbi:NUP35 protein, partial [Rhynochetos jubatus]|nr:NUP35 protein [Rhynochetos jubatus]